MQKLLVLINTTSCFLKWRHPRLISFRDINKKFRRKEMFNTFKNYFVGQHPKYLNKNIETLFDSYFVFVSYQIPGNEYDLG